MEREIGYSILSFADDCQYLGQHFPGWECSILTAGSNLHLPPIKVLVVHWHARLRFRHIVIPAVQLLLTPIQPTRTSPQLSPTRVKYVRNPTVLHRPAYIFIPRLVAMRAQQQRRLMIDIDRLPLARPRIVNLMVNPQMRHVILGHAVPPLPPFTVCIAVRKVVDSLDTTPVRDERELETIVLVNCRHSLAAEVAASFFRFGVEHRVHAVGVLDQGLRMRRKAA